MSTKDTLQIEVAEEIIARHTVVMEAVNHELNLRGERSSTPEQLSQASFERFRLQKDFRDYVNGLIYARYTPPTSIIHSLYYPDDHPTIEIEVTQEFPPVAELEENETSKQVSKKKNK